MKKEPEKRTNLSDVLSLVTSVNAMDVTSFNEAVQIDAQQMNLAALLLNRSVNHAEYVSS